MFDFAVTRKHLSAIFIPLHIPVRTVILLACGRFSDSICQPDPVAHKFLWILCLDIS